MSPNVRSTAAHATALCVVLLLSGKAVCQSNYFPVGPGDSWTLVDTAELRQHVVVGDWVSANDRSYFLLNIPFGRSDTLRIDSEGRVWEFLDGEEQVLFDFGAAGQTIYLPPDSWNAKKILVSRGITVTTPLGTFENCIVFDIDRAMVLGDYSYAFAPDVGLVRAADSTGVEYLLQSASVGGSSVATTSPNRRTSGGWLAYPIPTDGDLTIRPKHMNRVSGRARLVVFDLRGKKVMTRDLGVSGDRWQIDVSRLASGVYHAIVLQNGATASIRFVRR